MRKMRHGAKETVRAEVPNRIDLAGGTLDIYPLYLLVPGTVTVNAAIGVRSIVEIRRVRGAARIVAEGVSRAREAGTTHRFPRGGPFGLAAAALRTYPALTGVEIRFRNEAPVGTGLGASSALLVALMLAVESWLGIRGSWEERANRGMEIEAMHLRNLTGRQDHIAALRGGIQGIRCGPGTTVAERISPASREARIFERHAVLAFTGRSHFSAKVNWRMIRGAIEGNSEVLKKFGGIAGAARDAWEAVAAGDMGRLGRAVWREWSLRKTVAPGVSTRPVEALLADREFHRRVSGAKLCGAGGGGMLFCLLRRPEEREALESLLAGARFPAVPVRLSAGPKVSGVPRVR
ncbi:MAG: hypothetical protein Kow00128_14140 [Deltaproteobacteria bacterium]